MNRVETGHGPVKEPEYLRFGRQRFIEMRTGPKVFGNVVVIFEAFNDKEAAAQKNGEQEEADDGFGFIDLSSVNGKGHGEAAGQKNCCVNGAKGDDGVAAGFGE